MLSELWSTGTLWNLNDLLPPDSGWDLQVATAINDVGQIVGYGYHEGQPEGFLLTPIDSASSSSIPDPAAGLLLSLPAAASLLTRPRRRTP